MVLERVQEDAGSEGVRPRVLGLLVHALANANACGEVDDGIHAFERAADDLGVADVAGDKPDLGVEVVGSVRVAVHLFDQHVEGAHGVAGSQQLVGEVGADEARTAGDQDALSHARRLRAPGLWRGRDALVRVAATVVERS